MQRFCIVIGVLLAFLAYWALNFATPPNYCDSAFVYEPSFLPLPVSPSSYAGIVPKYRLLKVVPWQCAQSRKISDVCDVVHENGVPILFVHGNVGHYKQIIHFWAFSVDVQQEIMSVLFCSLIFSLSLSLSRCSSTFLLTSDNHLVVFPISCSIFFHWICKKKLLLLMEILCFDKHCS